MLRLHLHSAFHSILFSSLFLGMAPSTASADAIDGDWCRNGRHFTIDGQKIMTYGGTAMTGDYTRHTFSYIVPANEPEAGTEIIMQLQSETELRLFHQGGGTGRSRQSGPETWNRCRVTS
ncbi:MAG: hypothetical protein ACK5JT_10980 [Hyphomicrobiaceae bacterium]